MKFKLFLIPLLFFKILTHINWRFIKSTDLTNEEKIVGGQDENGNTEYICRDQHKFSSNENHIGRLSVVKNTCYVSHGGKEYKLTSAYDVLVKANNEIISCESISCLRDEGKDFKNLLNI